MRPDDGLTDVVSVRLDAGIRSGCSPRVLDRCAAVSAGTDVAVAVVEGSDFTSASLPVELDLNVDAARNLGAPVLLVVGGRDRSAAQILDAARDGVAVLTERGCTVLGVV
jgi:phosphate acetyltransferase